MNDFVEACRREWRRLGVPGPVAEEMAADLAADLDQAREEGIPAEEVLGDGVFDPAGFAATWATARGVVPGPGTETRPRRRWLPLASLASFAVVTLVGVALAVLAFHGASVVASVHPSSPGLPGRPFHGFTRNVGPPAPGLRPFAVTLLLVGLLGMGATAFLWVRRPSSRGDDQDWPGPRPAGPGH
ncbi:MAG TPA: hypothetical protein VHA76_02135 [Solirubrobacterales bacterium]|nr:hypothetical protein [Solirubrobacterales bacterium]